MNYFVWTLISFIIINCKKTLYIHIIALDPSDSQSLINQSINQNLTCSDCIVAYVVHLIKLDKYHEKKAKHVILALPIQCGN